MQRRHFLRQTGLAAGSLVSAGLVSSSHASMPLPAEKPFNLDYGFQDGMFAQHAGKDFVEQIKFGHSMGFRSIEDNGMMSRTPEEQERIGRTLSDLGMRMGVFVITTDRWHWSMTLATGKQEWKDRIVRDCKTAVEADQPRGVTWRTGVHGSFRPLEHHTRR